jgi:hypothetical protein
MHKARFVDVVIWNLWLPSTFTLSGKVSEFDQSGQKPSLERLHISYVSWNSSRAWVRFPSTLLHKFQIKFKCFVMLLHNTNECGLCCWPKHELVLNWTFIPKPGVLEFIWIFSGRNHLKINISHILNPNLTK